MNYVYQCKDEALDFETGVTRLEQRLGRKVDIGWPARTLGPEENERLVQALGLPTSRTELSKSAYEAFVKAAEYEKRCPNLYYDTLPEKSFEHFWAAHLLNLREGDNFVDIAASKSPHADIFRKLYGCNAFSQDIEYPPGVKNSRIGSDITSVPVPDAFFQSALLACSFEHFEGDADQGAIREIIRILLPWGRVVILPLHIHDFHHTVTDPCYTATREVPFDKEGTVRCIRNWQNRHGRFYSPQTLNSRIIQRFKNQLDFELHYAVNFRDIHPGLYCRFALVGTKI